MQFPTNLMNTYIGFPVLTILAIDFLYRYKKNRNSTSLYLGAACLLVAISQLFILLAALLDTDIKTASFLAYGADVFLTTGFLVLWLFSIRALLGSYPRFARIATIFVFLLAIACHVSAFYLDLMPPYSTQLVRSPDGILTMNFRYTLDYTILYSLNRLSLLFAGVYFFKQSNLVSSRSQRLRLQSLAFLIIVAVATSAIIPIVRIGAFQLNDLILAFGFLLCGVMAITDHYIKVRK
jgi:hypothetical protein